MIRFRKAVLIIHGFAGGTYDEEKLAIHLELNRKLDVYSFTLPGHDVKSREKATCKAWIKNSEELLEYLIKNGYKKIYVIGHSMGGVIACHLAVKYKEVKRLVLAAPAFSHLASKESGGIINAIEKSPELIKTYSSSEFFTRVKKLPVTALREFFQLVKAYQDTPEKIRIPVLILHGSKDQMVPPRSSEAVFAKINTRKKELIIIKNYFHDIFKGEKANLINEEIESFLTRSTIFMKEIRKDI